jgi:hypothetical protein
MYMCVCVCVMFRLCVCVLLLELCMVCVPKPFACMCVYVSRCHVRAFVCMLELNAGECILGNFARDATLHASVCVESMCVCVCL